MMSLLKSLVKRTPLASVHWFFLDMIRIFKPFRRSTDGFFFRGSTQMLRGEFEPLIREYVLSDYSRNRSLINIGANIGYYPCLAGSRHYKRIIAVEPDKTNFRIMRSNVERNEFQSTTLINAACSSSVGVANLWGRNTGASLVSDWEGNPPDNEVKVETTTLDIVFNLIPENDSILSIIDVEGFEYEVLKGAKEVLGSKRDITWIIEVSLWRSINGESILSSNLHELFELMKKAGYRVYKCDIGWPEFSDIEIKRMIDGEIIWPAFPIMFRK
jgi:FkbM family methyltransferase